MATAKKKVDLCDLWGSMVAGKRKPPKDESIWLRDAKFAFLYAKYFRKNKWNQEQETVFYGDVKALYNYSYWLMNDLKVVVPEHLDNFMIAKALENDNDTWADLYFKNIKKRLIKK